MLNYLLIVLLTFLTRPYIRHEKRSSWNQSIFCILSSVGLFHPNDWKQSNWAMQTLAYNHMHIQMHWYICCQILHSTEEQGFFLILDFFLLIQHAKYDILTSYSVPTCWLPDYDLLWSRNKLHNMKHVHPQRGLTAQTICIWRWQCKILNVFSSNYLTRGTWQYFLHDIHMIRLLRVCMQHLLEAGRRQRKAC